MMASRHDDLWEDLALVTHSPVYGTVGHGKRLPHAPPRIYALTPARRVVMSRARSPRPFLPSKARDERSEPIRHLPTGRTEPREKKRSKAVPTGEGCLLLLRFIHFPRFYSRGFHVRACLPDAGVGGQKQKVRRMRRPARARAN
jgi:hypothetical protein